MRVLIQSRATLFTVPGGDTVQILKTKAYLEKLGVTCDISLDLEPDLKKYALVHLFNLIRPQELYLQARNAKRQHKPVAVSPIYVDYTDYERNARPLPVGMVTKFLNMSQTEYLKILARALKNGEYHAGTKEVLRRGFKSLMQNILGMCDLLLPNSHSEMRRIAEAMGTCGKPYAVIPNAADPALFDPEKTPQSEKWRAYQDCVLCVARIEGRKNQLNLVKALKDAPYKLVIVGRAAPNHKGYAAKVYKLGEGKVGFEENIPHEELPALYKMARVHVLPSWMETTGLSTLEAGLMGCNVVISDKGDTRDYFGDYAYYCKPDSVRSIREAVEHAWAGNKNPGLRRHILQNFTWDKTAQLTLNAYRQVVQA